MLLIKGSNICKQHTNPEAKEQYLILAATVVLYLTPHRYIQVGVVCTPREFFLFFVHSLQGARKPLMLNESAKKKILLNLRSIKSTPNDTKFIQVFLSFRIEILGFLASP